MPLKIVRNDITKMKVDAIVNTANPMPGYGSGTDTAVYKAAGTEKLLKERQAIGVIERGHSAITNGYDLPARYIIHTVGTAWRDGCSGEESIVRSCYKSVFELALAHNVESLAIPLLASGSYGFPKGIALRIALSEIESFLAEHDIELYLVVFDEKTVSLCAEFYKDIDEYISSNYVEEKIVEEYCNTFRLRQEAYPEVRLFQDGVISDFSSKARSLEDVVSNLDKTFMETVFSFADERGMTDVEVQKRANLDRKAFSKLKCGTTKKPSKSTALALAVALKLNIDETKDLLSRAGFALSPCSRQDIIVQYFIERKIYDIHAINIALFEHNEPTLGMQSE